MADDGEDERRRDRSRWWDVFDVLDLLVLAGRALWALVAFLFSLAAD